MTTTTKILLASGGIALLALAAKTVQKATQLQNLSDKIKVGPVLPRVHSVSGGKATVVVDNLVVTNQSSLPINLDQLYVNISNNGADLITQTKPIQPVVIAAYGQTTIKNIEMEVPYTNLLPILDFIKGAGSKILNVSVRATVNGFEVPFNTEIDATKVFSNTSSLFSKVF